MTTPANARRQPAAVLEYLHVVGYFNKNIPAGQVLKRLVPIVQHACVGGSSSISGHGAFELEHDEIDRSTSYRAVGFDPKDARQVSSKSLRWPSFEEFGTSDLVKRLDGKWHRCGFSGSATRHPPLRVFDFNWHIYLRAEECYPHVQEDCIALVSIHASHFGGHERSKNAIAFVRSVFDCFESAGGLYYGLSETSVFQENAAGLGYVNFYENFASVRFRIEQDRWRDARELRRTRIRGLYPVQYLSIEHLNAFGGREKLVRDFQARFPRRGHLLQECGDSALIVSLSETPMDGSSLLGAGAGYIETASWVNQRALDASLFV